MTLNGVFVICFTTKTFIATGGTTTPIITVMPIIIPNQSGLYPSFWIAGKISRRKDHEGKIIDKGPPIR